MSNNKRVNRKRRRSPWYKMFAKTETRLSARVTSEEDWQTDVPNIRLSRAFVIVLLMHLVVGGALVAFTLMNPSEANAQAKTETAPKKSDKVAKASAKSEKKPDAKATRSTSDLTANDRMDDMRRHIVHSGDSVSKIARQYGISSEEIHAVNRIDELYQLYQGRVLRIPVSPSSPVPLNTRIAETPSVNGNNVVSSEPLRPPLTIPRASVAPAIEIAAPTEVEPIKESLLPPTVEGVSRPIVVEEPARPAEPVVQVTPPAPVREPEIVRPRNQPSIPVVAERPSSQKTYQVVKGDNAFRIAKRFGVHYKELLSHNSITDPSKLQIGQTLRIPN